MLLRLVHRTHYHYPGFAQQSQNEVRLMPLTDDTQVCKEFRITVSPWTKVHCYREPGGMVHHFGVRNPHAELDILAEATVETHIDNPFATVDMNDRDWSFYGSATTAAMYAEFLAPSPYVSEHPACRKIADDVRAASDGTIFGFLMELNRYINASLDYDPDVTHVHTKLDDVVDLQAGVCQDFAHLMIGCCRSIGIPARYVSGYLYVANAEGMRGEQATHAWLECILPGGRWLGLDPTNDLLANDRYIRVHTGRDYSEVAPTRGVYVGPVASSLDVSVSVEAAERPISALQSLT